MSLATVAVLNGGIQGLISRMDSELREQQLNDNFVEFTSAHFEPLYALNQITAEEAESLYNIANSMMNQEIIDALQYGIEAMENGQLTPADAAALLAVASVAYQRNIVDDQIMDYYFGFDGGEPRINDAL